MLDYATMTDEQYEAYVNDMYGTEDDYLISTVTDDQA